MAARDFEAPVVSLATVTRRGARDIDASQNRDPKAVTDASTAINK
ncbi:MAG: hypothetical protein WC889_00085 [Myxococcota bacterium]|jgi:hypothetical protein